MTGLCISSVIGLAILGNHGPEYEVRQTAYASREDCLQDWGSEQDCAPQPSNRTNYSGPRYYWDSSQNHPVIVQPDGTERVATTARIGSSGSTAGRTSIVGSFARGGFGRIGRGFSGGRGG